MATRNKSSRHSKPQPSDAKHAKVGSDPEAAKNFAGNHDFGAKESDTIERQYASRATRAGDKGEPPEHATGDGTRDVGVGSNASGPGSGSGGDLDTDIVGVGTGGSGVSTSGQIHEPRGPDDAQPASAVDPHRIAAHGASKPVKGSTIDHTGGDVATTGSGQGAAAITNPNDPDNDAASAEISLDEAAGADNSPSDRP